MDEEVSHDRAKEAVKLCLFSVNIMSFTKVESIVGHSAALKMSPSFLHSLTRLHYSVRKMWDMNLASQADRGTTTLFHSSLFIVFMATLSLLQMDGLFPFFQ